MSASFEWEVQKCSSRCFGCVVQAEPEIAIPKVVETSQTTVFTDELAGVSVGESAPMGDADMCDAVTSAGLSDFLKRPVRIHSFTYVEGDPIGFLSSVNPWHAFFNNANIKYKLNNYAFIRCDLKLKIIVNSSQFYYGAFRACYQPLQNFSPSGIVNLATKELIPYSQQPGFFMYPQDNEGGEMTLPFFYQKNFLRIQVAQDFTDMGILRFNNYAPLLSANGAVGVGVSVQVYAWAENVILAGPTVGLAMQAQNEYAQGIVSRPATNLARLAGMFKGIPIISKFATATEMGANAVAGIAQLFGFTNVPVIEPPNPFRPVAMPQFATSEIGFPVEKLTFDPKNELAIDPSIVGHSSEDELSIEALVTKQSFLTQVTWSTTTPIDTPLFTTLVHPNLVDISSMNVYMTPVALVNRLFGYWRGDIVFTFKVISSRFHKGRYRVSYDPANAGVQTTGDTGAVVFNTIVDIGTETDTEIRVPYQQALGWLKTDRTNSAIWSTSITPTLVYDDTKHNGTLSLKCLTLLTAPEATSSVTILVFARAADNFEVSYAQTPQLNMSSFAIQSQPELVGDATMPGQTGNDIVASRSRIYMGESVRSVRHLLRRVNHVDTTPLVSPVTDGLVWWHFPKLPPYYGFDTNGIHMARNSGGTADVKFNWTKLSAWHMISPCFVAQRGSFFWHINVDGPSSVQRLNVSKVSDTNVLTPSLATESYATLPSGIPRQTWQRQWPTGGGASMVNQTVSGCISVGTGNYTPYKFQAVNPIRSTLQVASGSSHDGNNLEAIRVEFPINNQAASKFKIERYFGVGTDYNLLFFLNVPTFYTYSAPAAPSA